uniref:Nuclear shuttle protein n=1 Tax=Soybean chlorotic blotch virus TaxID=761702 RepID=D6MTY1_9GEMI|nr:nuclear shuttle protein [Soybean chlorotic blotch virus]ALO02840.1 BV1 [Soybean chlorotic blotch virus]
MYTRHGRRLLRSSPYSHLTPSSSSRRHQESKFRHVTRNLNVYRPLFSSSDRGVFKRRTLGEVQHGPELVLRNATHVTTYVTYPTRYSNGDGRCTDYIKILNLKVSGRICIRDNVPTGDNTMGVYSGILGTFVMCFIRDKRPDVPDGANALPSFKDLFGNYEAAYADLRIVDVLRERFRLMSSIKIDVTSDLGECQRTLKHYLPVSSRKFPIWATFRDKDLSMATGNYKNISKNATLISYAWVSERDSTCQIYSQMLLSYLG